MLAAIIINNQKEILLARRKAGLAQEFKWEFPGGKLRRKETPESCLEREIFEELGIKIEVIDILTAVYHSYPEKDILLLAYIAIFKSGEIILTDHQEALWIEIENVLSFDLSDADVPVAKLLQKEFADFNLKLNRDTD